MLDLQGLEPVREHGGHSGHGGGGSNLTVTLCESRTPSNLSVAACH